MERRRLFLWITGFTVLLAGVLWLSGGPLEAPQEDGAAVMDAVMDKLGVTRQTAVLGWLDADAANRGAVPVVWIARGGKVHYHSYPLCDHMKAPVAYSLQDAEAMGYLPCSKCCESGGEG